MGMEEITGGERSWAEREGAGRALKGGDRLNVSNGEGK